MQIDRSRFLMLTASIAAGGCSGSQQPAPVEVPEQQVVVIAPVLPPPTPAPQAVASAEPEAVEAEAVPAEPPGPSDEDAFDAADRELAQAPATCGNTKGTVGACTGLRAPGPSCESFFDTREQCNGFVRGMQPRAASKAVACLLARSGKREICQFDAAQKCAVEAIKSVCIEPYSDQPCRTMMSFCRGGRFGNITQQQCQRALSAVKGQYRPQLLSCMTESCSADYRFYSLL